jgi:hypothetical protein
MLITKKSLKTIYSGNIILTFCIVVVSSLVIFAFAMGKQNTSLELGHQEMEGLLGGSSTCCDNCGDVYVYFSECYHTQKFPTTPNCVENSHLCIYNSVVTASCLPGAPNANGCDTDTDYPVTPSLHQDIYSITPECNWYNSNWSIARIIFYGCDTSSSKLCDAYFYFKACDKAGGICSGEWLEDDDFAKPKQACAICS